MCGIVGTLSNERIEPNFIENSIKSIKHRGPDADGFWLSNGEKVFLGHTRLSIIDLSPTGSQPMEFVDKNGYKYIITFNGEIYNYKKIKEELKGLGYEFRGDSDTEVILKSFVEWGRKCVEKFIGMFAFAIYAESEEKFYLCRDRFGVKPLYYQKTQSDFIFASELKAITRFNNFSKKINKKALATYFQLGFVPAPQTIYEDVYKLESGSWLIVDKNLDIKTEKYWSANNYFNNDYNNLSEKEILTELEKKLITSFQYRMVADVDVGVFLSGGIDSSLLTALLQNNTDKKIKTFSIGFAENDYDEAPYARKIAERLGTDHHEFYISSEQVLKNLDEYINIFDEPFGDSSGLPTFLLSKYTKDFVKVVLSGDGGDELFAGYSKYEALWKLEKMSVLKINFLKLLFKIFKPEELAKLVSLVFKNKYSNLSQKLSKFSQVLTSNNFSTRFKKAGSYWTLDELNNLFVGPVEDNLDKYYSENKANKIEQMQLWDINLYLQDDILVKTDRTTMAAGLEGREPFLDKDILDFVSKIKPEIKYKDLGNKYLLRKILYKYLDKNLFDRPKTGFVPPIEKWLKQDLVEKLDYCLNLDKIKKQGILNPVYVEKILKDFKSEKYINPNKIWLLFVFQMWYDNFNN